MDTSTDKLLETLLWFWVLRVPQLLATVSGAGYSVFLIARHGRIGSVLAAGCGVLLLSLILFPIVVHVLLPKAVLPSSDATNLEDLIRRYDSLLNFTRGATLCFSGMDAIGISLLVYGVALERSRTSVPLFPPSMQAE